MAKFWAIFIAFALKCNFIYIFTKAEDYDCFEYPTYIMILFGVSALLWDACIFPENFRRLHPCCEFTIEFAIVIFLMEFIWNDFLVPIENDFVYLIVPSIGEAIQFLMSTAGLEVGCVNDFCKLLKTDDAKMGASYAFGLFFLLFTTQITRLIDLRILKCDGPKAFICDAKYRTKRFLHELFWHCQNYCATGYQEPPFYIS